MAKDIVGDIMDTTIKHYLDGEIVKWSKRRWIRKKVGRASPPIHWIEEGEPVPEGWELVPERK